MPDPSFDDADTPNAHTVLSIASIGVPPYSARGLKQSYAPITQAAQLKRTVDGVLNDISFDGFHKYASSISGEDQEPPAVDGVWPGLLVVVDCIFELSYKTATGTAQRTVVPGSSRTSGNYTLYRPRLTMRIVNFSCERDEYGASISWSMDLEEV